MAFHVIHYGEVKVLLLDLAAKREWFKIIFSNSERVMHCVTKISALVLTGAHNPFSVKNKNKRSAVSAPGMHTTHRSRRVVFIHVSKCTCRIKIGLNAHLLGCAGPP